MIATTAAKIGRSMKKRENIDGSAWPTGATVMSTRRAWSSLPLPVTLTGGTSRMRSRIDAELRRARRARPSRAASRARRWPRRCRSCRRSPVIVICGADARRTPPRRSAWRAARRCRASPGPARNRTEHAGRRRAAAAGAAAPAGRRGRRPRAARTASPSPPRPAARRTPPSTTTLSPLSGLRR